MENKEANPKGILNILSLIHFAITFGLFAVGLFFYWLQDDWVMEFSDMGYKFPYAVPISAVLGVFAGKSLFRHQLSSLNRVNTLGAKLSGYMTASIVKYACLEAPGFFGLFAAQETGNLAYLIITVLMVLIMIIERPTKNKTELDLNLDRELKLEFEKSIKAN
ncbi:hypothetical protein AB8P51_14975 [Muriicola sp. SD30]|uniref:hypothetical protein n=1 Tax=Muriicola sp. SD30 TaxID=3240936 RepID=UPI00350FC20E